MSDENTAHKAEGKSSTGIAIPETVPYAESDSALPVPNFSSRAG